MKEKIVPIASVGVGLVAFVLTLQYWNIKNRELESEWQRLETAQQKVNIMVAARNIPRGTALVYSDLIEVPKYRSDIVSDAMDRYDASLALGKKTLRGLAKGDQLTWGNIEGGQASVLGLAPMIKYGMRAISISVGGAAAVSGMVRPNDRVDVLGTFTFPAEGSAGTMETATLTVLQDVLVLATGQTLARDRPDARRRDASYSTVTLEVSARVAELLVFAQQTNGRLTLSLRMPEDVDYEGSMPKVNFDHIQSRLEEYNSHRQRELLKKAHRPSR